MRNQVRYVRFAGCSRRSFLRTVGGAAAAGSLLPSPGRVRSDDAALLRAREKARRRQRRLILNDDGDNAHYIGPEDGPEEFLATRCGPWLDGTPVHSVAWCLIWSVGWSRALDAWATAGFPSTGFPRKLDPEQMAPRYWQTQMLGTPLTAKMPDPTPVMVDYCRRHNLEIFGSLRMNDTHDAFGQPFRKLVYPLKVKHPEFLLGDEKSDSEPRATSLAKWRWSGLDYAHAEVREDRFWWINNTATKYDVDGVDLNFFRHPWFFKLGEEQRNMPLMTDLIRRARRRFDEIGRERGRPMLLGVRVLGNVEICRNAGLDVETWLEEGLIDRLIIGGLYVSTCTGAEELIELGHRYGVPVYPSFRCDSPLFGIGLHKGGEPPHGPEAMRGHAANLWNAGADGLYLWNYHYIRTSKHPRGRPRPEDYRFLSEIGEPSRLARLDKIFVVNPSDENLKGIWPFFLASAPLPLPVPIAAASAQRHAVSVRIGDDIQTAADGGALKSLSLGLKLDADPTRLGLVVRFNGQRVGDGARRADDSNWIDFPLQPAIVKQGINQLEVAMREPGPKTEDAPQLVQVWVTVRYKS